jgi:hypothetical protein
VKWKSSNPDLVYIDANTGKVTIRGATNGTEVKITAVKAGYESSITFTVGKKPITVMADNKEKKAGASDPALTYIVSPALVKGDSIIGSLKYFGTEPGTYSIVEDVPFISPNYQIMFISGTMTITGNGGDSSGDSSTDSGESSSLLWLVVILILIILLAGFLFFIIAAKRRKEREGEEDKPL